MNELSTVLSTEHMTVSDRLILKVIGLLQSSPEIVSYNLNTSYGSDEALEVKANGLTVRIQVRG